MERLGRACGTIKYLYSIYIILDIEKIKKNNNTTISN